MSYRLQDLRQSRNYTWPRVDELVGTILSL